MDLVQFLSEGDHPIEVSLRPEKRFDLFKDCVNRGYVHVRFTDTRGGTELGVEIDPARSDLAAMQNTSRSGHVVFAGNLTLDGVPVTCVAKVDLTTLDGVGHLEIRKT